VAISVLGPLRTTVGDSELTGALRKARELLAYLAVHPDGATGERISADLWLESSPRYAASQRKLALRKAREMLRTATGLPAPMFIVLAGDRYRLDLALIDVDLWRFDAALDRAREASGEQEQLSALEQATALYRGPLAEGAGYDWAEYYAEPGRRRAVDALSRTAAILQPRHPEHALSVLEAGRPVRHGPHRQAQPCRRRPRGWHSRHWRGDLRRARHRARPARQARGPGKSAQRRLRRDQLGHERPGLRHPRRGFSRVRDLDG
jgi:hypothetical protein